MSASIVQSEELLEIGRFKEEEPGEWTFVQADRVDRQLELDDRIRFERPGYGEPGATCGIPAPWYCPDHGVQWVPSKCRRRECPDCVDPWAWRAANRARERLAYGKKLYCISRWGVRHATVSFDDQLVPDSKVELDRQFRLVYRTLGAMGLWGGLTVFHPWRKRCSECLEPLDCGSKKYCHPGASLSWVKGPHFHAVGYGALNASARPEGVFVKSMPRRRSIAGTIKYLLDHCGIPLPFLRLEISGVDSTRDRASKSTNSEPPPPNGILYDGLEPGVTTLSPMMLL